MRQNIPALQVFSFLYPASGSSVNVPLTRPQFILWLFTQRLGNFNSTNCIRTFSVSRQPQNVFLQMPRRRVSRAESRSVGRTNRTSGECLGRSTRTKIYCFVPLSFAFSTSSKSPRMFLI